MNHSSILSMENILFPPSWSSKHGVATIHSEYQLNKYIPYIFPFFFAILLSVSFRLHTGSCISVSNSVSRSMILKDDSLIQSHYISSNNVRY